MRKTLYDRMKLDAAKNERDKNYFYQFYNGHGIMADINAILENDTVLALERDDSSDVIKVKTVKGDIYHYTPDGSLSLISRSRSLSAGSGMRIQSRPGEFLAYDDAGDLIHAHGCSTDDYTMSRRNKLLLTC